MTIRRDTQLTRRIGEYLAAAELGRRGWIATTFAGSVHHALYPKRIAPYQDYWATLDLNP